MMKIRGFIEGFYNRKPKKNDYGFKGNILPITFMRQKKILTSGKNGELKINLLKHEAFPKI